MRRIIEAGSEEGDLVGDFFCGSGSVLEAAYSLGRRFAGCDSEELAAAMSRKRLKKAGADFRFLKESEAATGSGKADITVVSKDELSDGRFMYKCRLTDFVPDIETGSIRMKDRAYVEEAIKADRLQFADHVMVDPDYNGRFDCRYIFDLKTEEITFITKGKAALTVVDIFVKEYPAEVN